MGQGNIEMDGLRRSGRFEALGRSGRLEARDALRGDDVNSVVLNISFSTTTVVVVNTSSSTTVVNTSSSTTLYYRMIYLMPAFDTIETVLVKKLHFKPTGTLRFVACTVYVAFTMFTAITSPFFGGLLLFSGGFAFAPTTYFLSRILVVKLNSFSFYGDSSSVLYCSSFNSSATGFAYYRYASYSGFC